MLAGPLLGLLNPNPTLGPNGSGRRRRDTMAEMFHIEVRDLSDLCPLNSRFMSEQNIGTFDQLSR